MEKITVSGMLMFVWFCFAFAGSVAAAPVVLFDQAHDQRFVITKDEPLQLSGFAAVMKTEGLDVRSSSAPLTDESLKGVAALVISGPFRSLDAAEVEAVARFIERGGRLATMLHVPYPLVELLNRLNVKCSKAVLSEQENIIDGDKINFKVKAFEVDPLFTGIDQFSFYGGWALMNTAPAARVVAKTSPKAWIDLNRDSRLGKGDAMQAFGVVVTGELGGGRFVVFGDDAIFQNKFLVEQNRQLAINLARWFK